MGATKAVARALGAVWAWPHLLRYALARTVLGPERAFIAASEGVASIPGYRGLYTRQAFYRRTLAESGQDVYYGFMSVLSKSQARIGEGVYIGRFCTVGWARIGAGAMLADGVQVLSGGHQHAPRLAAEGLREGSEDEKAVEFREVSIGARAWLGAGAIVMADVGEGAIVGAGAVVVRPVAAGARVGGVPARPLESRGEGI